MTKGYLRPRPIRVAYFVEETEHWREMLEGIFNDSFRRWGGRFSLIIPCRDGAIAPDYAGWLLKYNPDIIYSFVDLTDTYLERLHEKFYPSLLLKHRFWGGKRDPQDFRPRIPIPTVGSLSVTPTLSRGSPFAPSQPVPLVDCYPTFAPSLFLQETFGVHAKCADPWPISHELSQYVTPVTIVPPDVEADGRMVPPRVVDIVSSETDMLDAIRKRRNLTGVAQLSACLTPRLQIRTSWSNQVNLIVGDSFTDRVVFWNARAHQSGYLDNGLVTLKIEEADVEDPTRFETIVGIIQDRIHVSETGSPNNTIAIRSASIELERLDAIRDKFRSRDHWNIYLCQTLESASACVPDNVALSQAIQLVEPGAPHQSSEWHEFNFSGDEFRPPKVAPRLLREIGQVPHSLSGAWALDLDLERENNHSRFVNVQHRWRLPKRIRAAGAFLRGYALENFGVTCIPRVTEGGVLSVFATKDGEMPELTVPSDERAIQYALCAPRDWLPFDYGRGPLSNSLVYEMQPSDKGRYLKALLRFTGGIDGSRRVFLDRFWLTEFEALGASPRNGDDKIPAIVRTLKKRLGNQLQVSNDQQWERIGRVVAQEARHVRLAPRHIRFDELAARFETFRNDYWSVNQPGAPREEWDQEERDSLGDSVQYLCSRDILHQGYEWLCHRCKYNNWLSIDVLRRTMTCEVCASTAPAPVDQTWYFKLNAFVLEGLRDHGLLANLWCLNRLSEKASESFYFMEPHELFLTSEAAIRRRSDAEFDLIAVADGKVYLCEAKTSGRDIDIEKFARTARLLRPDVATLAVMEMAHPAIDRKFQELRKLLADDDIEVELLVLHNGDIDAAPNLPSGDSYTVKVF